MKFHDFEEFLIHILKLTRKCLKNALCSFLLDCFRELLAFARTVGPEAADGSAHTSLRLGMRAVREILGLFPNVCSLAASHRSGEVFFA